MAEIKTLNGHEIVDAKARERLDTLEKEGVGGGGGDVTTEAMNKAIADAIQEHNEQIQVHQTRLAPMAEELMTLKKNVSELTAEKVGADPAGTAATKVSEHDTYTGSHNDIRLLIQGLSGRLDALANSDDTTLDDLKEIVTYIKANKGLIDSITTSKVSVEDIIDNLTTNVNNRPLSAAQGVALKNLIDALGNSKLDASALGAAVDQALLIAKESGEFKGDPYTLTEDDKVEIVSEATEALKSEGSGVVLYTTQNLTEAQKAQARANIGATAGEEVNFADSVEDIPEDADKTATYVLLDGYKYTWKEKTINVVHNANNEDAKINLAPPTNATDADDSFVSKPGTFTSARIPFSSDWLASGEAVRAKSTVTISGISKLTPAYNSSVIVYYYKADGTFIVAVLSKNLASIGGIPNADDIPLPVSFMIKDNNATGISSWADVGYVRIMVGISKDGNISESDIENLSINVPYYDSEETVSGWFSTGQQYSNDKVTQQNSADIATLKERTDTLESGVEELRVAVESGVVSVPNRRTIYFVGDSITFGSGASNYGTLQAGWVNEVMNRCGYDTTTSKNLGVSGAGFVQLSPSSTPVTILDIVNANNFSAVDDIIVSAGINDWKNSSVAIADFWNNFKAVFVKLRADNKYARIYYQLPYNCKISAWTGSTYDTHYALDYKEGGSGNYCLQKLNFCVRNGNRWTLCVSNTDYYRFFYGNVMHLQGFEPGTH